MFNPVAKLDGLIRRARLRALVFVASIGLGSLLCASACAGEVKKYAKEFYHDFRSGALHKDLAFFGDNEEKYVKVEPQGLRITLPKTWTHPFGGLGCKTAFSIQGDFEITTTYEILHAETPTKGYGVGVGLRVQKQKPASDLANVSRLVRLGDRQIILWNRSIETPGEKAKFPEGALPCTEKLGRLRLKRTGATLYYYWAPGGAGDEFNEIKNLEFGTEEIRAAYLTGQTGLEPNELDVRFLDLRIRSGTPVAGEVKGPAPVPAPVPTPPRTNQPEAPPRGWLAAAVLAGLAILVLLAIVVGLWLFVRRGQAAPPLQNTGMKPKPDTASVSFPCPDCGKNLKVKAASAGKKVKCPHCGETVLVPQADADDE